MGVGIPPEVIASYLVGGLVLAAGLFTLVRRKSWSERRGMQRLLLVGPLCYAIPLAAFGTEHLTIASSIARAIPAWIPWHLAWTYALGICFILAAFSLVTGIQRQLAASLVAFNFFLFVLLMDAPGWARNPGSRFAMALTLRELAFSGGPLALAASLATQWPERLRRRLITLGRYFVAIPVAVYCVEQFLHGDYVPGLPLNRVTPTWLWGHAIWTYVSAASYVVPAALLLAGRRTALAATWLGASVPFIVVVAYVPIAVVDRTSLLGLNFIFDTLMFGGTILLLANALTDAPMFQG